MWLHTIVITCSNRINTLGFRKKIHPFFSCQLLCACKMDRSWSGTCWMVQGTNSPVFFDSFCKIVYDNSDDNVVCEVISLHTVKWKPCFKRPRKFFFPLMGNQHSPRSVVNHLAVKVAHSMEHSLKGYADDVTLISICITNNWPESSRFGFDFKPSKWISFLFDGTKLFREVCHYLTAQSHLSKRAYIIFGVIDWCFSASATKKTASKQILSHLTDITATDSLPIGGKISYGFTETI